MANKEKIKKLVGIVEKQNILYVDLMSESKANREAEIHILKKSVSYAVMMLSMNHKNLGSTSRLTPIVTTRSHIDIESVLLSAENGVASISVYFYGDIKNERGIDHVNIEVSSAQIVATLHAMSQVQLDKLKSDGTVELDAFVCKNNEETKQLMEQIPMTFNKDIVDAIIPTIKEKLECDDADDLIDSIKDILDED